MKVKNRIAMALLAIGLSGSWVGNASAIVIEGTFSLVQNTAPTQTYTGSFTTVDTGMAGAGDSVALSSFLLDSTFSPTFPLGGGIALIFSDTTNLSVILASNTSVRRLDGTVENDNCDPIIGPCFTASFTPDLQDANQGDWGVGGGFPPGLFLQGDQFIPEPSALALMGIGLVAFGSVYRRRKQA